MKDMDANSQTGKRITIRVGTATLSFSVADTTNKRQPIVYMPYDLKNGISMAANLREAFHECSLLTSDTRKARVLVSAPVLMIPIEQYHDNQTELLYRHAFRDSEQLAVVSNVLPTLNAVAVFGINKDLRTVLNDHFTELQFIHAATPVWNYLHQRSFTGHHNKLYVYFHDRQMEAFSYQQHRFKFCNTFPGTRVQDCVYYLLNVWKQLNLQEEADEMYLLGDIIEKDTLTTELRRYLMKVYTINPSAEFNRAPATQVQGMPFDLMTLYTRGR